jgi:DNA modification methylase
MVSPPNRSAECSSPEHSRISAPIYRQDYRGFLESKKLTDIPTGFDVALDDLPSVLFPFQKPIVRFSVRRGRSAIFADTGLGKTAMQTTWASLVTHHTGKPVLILAPLSVALQTVGEAEKFGIKVTYHREQPADPQGVIIANYEMMDRFDFSAFAGLVLDESSILKSYAGKTCQSIIDASRSVPFRLSCTATPSPNDFEELGNQAEFVGVMSREEMLAMFFTHDGGDTSKWRLKGHGEKRFWEWLATWAVVIRKPSDLGFDDGAYNLPPLHIHEHIIESNKAAEGQLFYMPAMGLNEQRAAKRESMSDRVGVLSELVNESNEQWVIWCHTNPESDALGKSLSESRTVTGSDSIEHKESAIADFLSGDLKKIISKESIFGYGLNLQHCNHMASVGLENSFEKFYQGIRRCWRFGQTKPVHVHLFLTEAELPILENIKRKEAQHNEMSARMVEHMKEFMQREIFGMKAEKSEYLRDIARGKDWTIHLGDCVEVVSEIQSESIGFSVFSPPFASLYTYSNSDRDMGNCKSKDEFMQHFGYLVKELERVTMPGRLCSVHCMNLPTSKQHHGYIGIDDFRGDIIRLFQSHGWIYHSEVCIWKDPVTAMQRTKALGLLHKTIRKDSSMSRQGVPDYLVTFRKPGVNPDPISHTHDEFPVELWQRYASPVWFDINPSDTLQFRTARENEDERHICPLQLGVIERSIELWSKPGDLVLSPFAGIGSEGYSAVYMKRRFIGVELKRSYFDLAVKNMKSLSEQADLFSFEQEEAMA